MFSRSETLSAVGRSRSFISVDDAIPLVNQFDKCKNIPVTYKIPDSFFNDSNSIDIEGKTYTKNTFYNVPGTKAILNTGTGKIAGVVSPRYNAINHSDAFDPIIQGIKTCSESVMINIENDRDIVRLECLFKDHKIHDDSNEGIIPGFKFTSGYDGKTSIKGEFYGLRLACLNGMTLKTIVNGITLNIRHLEKATETIEYIHDFINKILSNIEYI